MRSPIKLAILQGALYTSIAFFTPVASFLGSDAPITGRSLSAIGVGALVAGATALKAYLSPTHPQDFARHVPPESPAPTPDARFAPDPRFTPQWDSRLEVTREERL